VKFIRRKPDRQPRPLQHLTWADMHEEYKKWAGEAHNQIQLESFKDVATGPIQVEDFTPGSAAGYKQFVTDMIAHIEQPGSSVHDQTGRQKRAGRRPYWNAERLAEVASVYDAAWQRGADPTKAVAEHVAVTWKGPISRSLAAKQVARCRRIEIGLLPATQPGKTRGNQEGKR
jgi:hypothetical protein